MSHPDLRVRATRVIRGVSVASLVFAAAAGAQITPQPLAVNKANWDLAAKFNGEGMRGMTFSSNLQGRWVGETDSLFYSWGDHTGTTWYLVNAVTRAKKPLFDHTKLAAQLSTAETKAFDSKRLQLNTLNFTKDHKNIRFNIDSTRYNWSLAGETLTRHGQYRGNQDSLLIKDEETFGGGGGGGRGGRGGGGGRGAAPAGRGATPDWKNFSPDSTAFVFGREHNLYFVEVGKPDTVQITTEGVDRYSFAGGGGGRGGVQQDSTENDDDDNNTGGRSGRGTAAPRNVRPNVTWAGDSKAFYVSRTDSREVKPLWVIDVLGEPRPTLETYNYAMPGETEVNKSEIWTYARGERAMKKQEPLNKWRDQRYFGGGTMANFGGINEDTDGPDTRVGRPSGYWNTGTSATMRLVRRDRLQRNLKYVELNPATGAVKVLVTESSANGSLENQGPFIVKQGGDFIWWSERTGWGHYYLYSHDGTLKRALTSGDWRADQLAAVDTVRGFAYIRGQGREPGENLYYTHLYRVNLADASIALLDAGNYTHNSSLHPKFKYIVDQFSRTDTAPKVVLRDGMTGRHLMDLESTDMSRLTEAGWRYPTPFTTLAADGVTPIHGNMWKPFDFDSTKKYPIIAHVYPGPQTESVTSGFTAAGMPMQLAQLGFIVVQIGNRGGTPARSNAYQNFSYWNLRDYALADKKTGIEQLASRYSFIDLDRVGIFGHSGGGYLTGAALLLPPYNEFFKVGVSSAGNHDNNIYNQNWSEQYHGLKWVAAADTACLTAQARGRQCVTANAGGRGGRGGAGGRGGRGGGRGNGGGGGPGNGQNGANGEGGGTPPDSVFWIYIPTNIDIASNLKGKLLLTTGEIDNNVHPGNTIRLVNALIQNNKRFDYMVFPGQRHGFGPMQPYFNRMLMEYFAEHLLGDYNRSSSDMNNHK